jgi:hypothetical protein
LFIDNVIQKEAENKLKYKNLSIEIKRVWKMQYFVILVITGATGMVKTLKTRKQFQVQKTAVLGTSHIVSKMLQSET